MRSNRFIFLLIFGAFLTSFVLLQGRSSIVIYLIGDSTMSVKETGAYPETGWGMPFVYFFDSTVSVENHAVNGRSTKSFMEENRWKPIVDKLEKGDYVLIQFGHNDEVPSKVGRYTTPEEYQGNLRKYVRDTKSKGANPILITPVSRRSFDDQGMLLDTHKEYSELVRQVAHAEKVPLIDLDKKSQRVLSEIGAENSKYLYLHLEAGEHPNYPGGKEDNTHLNELGARIVAQLVLGGIVENDQEIANRIVKGKR